MMKAASALGLVITSGSVGLEATGHDDKLHPGTLYERHRGPGAAEDAQISTDYTLMAASPVAAEPRRGGPFAFERWRPPLKSGD